MARNRRKKALYEVIGGSRSDTGTDRSLKNQTSGTDSSSAGPIIHGRTNWSSRSRLIQFTAGRLEISISYHLAFAVVLGLVLLLVVFFHLGKSSQKKVFQDAGIRQGTSKQARRITAAELQKNTVGKRTPTSGSNAAIVGSTGNNRIVIQTFQQADALVPVQQYFASKGIATEIASYGKMYYLRTVNKYENPGRKGTDGYYALQRIVKIGGKYKAPKGYETFGSKPFQDAYGMKFSD